MSGRQNIPVTGYFPHPGLGARPLHPLTKSTSMPVLRSQYYRSSAASSAGPHTQSSSTASSSGSVTPASSRSTAASSPVSGARGAGIPLKSQVQVLNSSNLKHTMPAQQTKPKEVEMLGFSSWKRDQFRVHGTIQDAIGRKPVNIVLYRPSLILGTLARLYRPNQHLLLWTKYAGTTIEDVSFVGDVTWANGAWSVTFLDSKHPNADPYLLPVSGNAPIVWPVKEWACQLPKKRKFRVRFFEMGESRSAHVEALL